jgi:hypothetical protein
LDGSRISDLALRGAKVARIEGTARGQ